MAEPLWSIPKVFFLISYITDTYEAYSTYVDDQYLDNHDYDDDTDAETGNDIGDDTDYDINTHTIVWSV